MFYFSNWSVVVLDTDIFSMSHFCENKYIFNLSIRVSINVNRNKQVIPQGEYI